MTTTRSTTDILADIDELTASTPQQAHELTIANGVITDTVVEAGVNPDSGLADELDAAAVAAEAPEVAESEAPEVIEMRYDTVAGYVPANLDTADEINAWLDEQARLHATREETPEEAQVSADELRQQIINDAMATSEGVQGENNWGAERERRRRQREATEQAVVLFGELRDYFGGYLVFPESVRDYYLDVLAAWTLHTYSSKISGVTPYLAITAPTQGSGKTTVLEILSTVAFNPSNIEVNPTPAVIRVFADERRTLFIDEIDQLSADKNFVAVMNSGYKSGGSVTRVGRKKGDTTTEKSNTFCPKVIAGIAREGTLPMPSATLERCITIRIMRAKSGELTKRFRVDVMRDQPEVSGLRDWMSVWTLANHKDIRDAYVDLPDLSTTRAQQIWEPLITLGGLISPEIGARITAAAVAIDGGTEQNIDPNAALVVDIERIIAAYQEVAPTARDIRVDDLAGLRNVLTGRKLNGKLTSDQVVRRLGAFNIQAAVIADDKGEEFQVYNLTDESGDLLPEWVDLFDRYAS